VITPTEEHISAWRYPVGGNELRAVSLEGNQIAAAVTISMGSH
jgi:hypothetical protein